VPPSNNSALRNAGTDAINFYKSNAQVTTETTTGSYVVTITDWNAMNNFYTDNFTTDAQVAALMLLMYRLPIIIYVTIQTLPWPMPVHMH
jgi:hypothetical protein